jgi:hypothetical protein
MAASGHVQPHDQRKGDTFMSTESVSEATVVPVRPIEPPCWPENPHWLEGATEIFLPSEKYLRAHWYAELLDIDDKNVHDTIIERKDPFKVRFQVRLAGRLWKCICASWCFDVCFTAIGDGEDFDLSDRSATLKSELRIPDWKGCQTRCIDLCVEVPPNTIPVGECGTLYQLGAKFELRCCGECGDPRSTLAVAGHKPLGEYMFV